MPEKQLNHFIPRLMLKHWAKDGGDKRLGVYVYEIVQSRFLFAEARGKKAFSFAIVKNLYIPVIDDVRRTALEDWFSGLEGTLASAIHNFSEGKIPELTDPKEYPKLLMAVFSFKYRTRAFVEHVRDYLTANPDIKNSHDADKTGQLIVLENIINATREDIAYHGNCDFQVCISKNTSFIMGDRPFLEKVMDDWDLLILSDKLLLMIRKNNLNIPRFKFQTISDELVHTTNQLIAEQAYYWIVAESKEQLQKYRQNADQKQQIKISYVPPKHLSSGFYFNGQ